MVTVVVTPESESLSSTSETRVARIQGNGKETKTMMSTRLLAFVAAGVVACGGSTTSSEDPLAGGAGRASTPGSAAGNGGANTGAANTTGAYAGAYDVPVTSPELAPAATFALAEIAWTVSGDQARLAYNLPRGLVGTSVRVDFAGTIDVATGRATLTGDAGTSECTTTATTVVCNEVMRGLLPLAGDLGVVASIAQVEYPSAPNDRVLVAQKFIGDPIGIVRVDLTKPVTPGTTPEDNHGGGKGKGN